MKTGLLNTLQTGNLGLQIFIVSGTAYCSDGPMILNTNKNAIFLLLNTKQNITYCVTIRRFRAFKEKKYYGNKQLITEAGKCPAVAGHEKRGFREEKFCNSRSSIEGLTSNISIGAFEYRNEHRIRVPCRRPYQRPRCQ